MKKCYFNKTFIKFERQKIIYNKVVSKISPCEIYFIEKELGFKSADFLFLLL